MTIDPRDAQALQNGLSWENFRKTLKALARFSIRDMEEPKKWWQILISVKNCSLRKPTIPSTQTNIRIAKLQREFIIEISAWTAFNDRLQTGNYLALIQNLYFCLKTKQTFSEGERGTTIWTTVTIIAASLKDFALKVTYVFYMYSREVRKPYFCKRLRRWIIFFLIGKRQQMQINVK